MTLYPNEEVFDVFSTDNPLIAMFGSLAIILVVSLVFLMYDYFFRQVVGHKQAVLEAKRIFVRYISHEMRTPMNTICIGSNLLQETLSKFADADQDKTGPKSNNTMEKVPEDSTVAHPLSLSQLRAQIKDWSDITSDILVNANSAVNVLSDLLNYDKVESGTLPLELTIISVTSLVERVASEFRLAAYAKSIKYSVEFSNHMIEHGEHDDENSSQCHSENTKATHAIEDCEVATSPVVCAPANSTSSIVVEQQFTVGDTVRLGQVLRSFISNAFELTQNDGTQIKRSWHCLTCRNLFNFSNFWHFYSSLVKAI